MPDAFRHQVPGKAFDARARQQARDGTHCGWKWSKWRKGWLQRHPLCEDCGRLAQCVHHIVPRHVAPERMYDETNVASLCTHCHEVRHGKTAF